MDLNYNTSCQRFMLSLFTIMIIIKAYVIKLRCIDGSNSNNNIFYNYILLNSLIIVVKECAYTIIICT